MQEVEEESSSIVFLMVSEVVMHLRYILFLHLPDLKPQLLVVLNIVVLYWSFVTPTENVLHAGFFISWLILCPKGAVSLRLERGEELYLALLELLILNRDQVFLLLSLLNVRL